MLSKIIIKPEPAIIISVNLIKQIIKTELTIALKKENYIIMKEDKEIIYGGDILVSPPTGGNNYPSETVYPSNTSYPGD